MLPVLLDLYGFLLALNIVEILAKKIQFFFTNSPKLKVEFYRHKQYGKLLLEQILNKIRGYRIAREILFSYPLNINVGS